MGACKSTSCSTKVECSVNMCFQGAAEPFCVKKTKRSFRKCLNKEIKRHKHKSTTVKHCVVLYFCHPFFHSCGFWTKWLVEAAAGPRRWTGGGWELDWCVGLRLGALEGSRVTEHPANLPSLPSDKLPQHELFISCLD